MNLKKSNASILMIAVVLIVLAGCTATEEAPTPTVEVPVVPTETEMLTATEAPAPTNTPTPEPTATPLSYPSARKFHSMIYDPVADVVLLFGGRSDQANLYGDIWAYKTDTNTWTPVGSISKDYLAPTYHTGAKQVVLYAGSTSHGGSWKDRGKTTIYDYATNTKESMKADATPFGYHGAQLAYDEESDVVILFGGSNVSALENHDDTFAYDLNANTWTNMAPATKPTARNYQVMVYHPTIDRVVMFGGNMFGSEGLDETWMYDYNTNTWELVPVSNAPSWRFYSAMVYVSSLDKLILFGGATKETGIVNDLWAFDHNENTWIELQPDNPPAARERHTMAYDSNADKIVLFGGSDINTDNLNDTWIYDPQTNAWMEMTPGN